MQLTKGRALDLLTSFRVYVRVADTGSFSAAAKELGVTQPSVSRQISALEAHLGVALLHRTTRSLTLTADGRTFLGHARTALDAAERAESAVGRHGKGLHGLVRISAAVTFGRVVIAPLIRPLLERHPGLEIDLRLDDTPGDLAHDAIDLAIRAGELQGAMLVGRRIGWVSPCVIGSIDYLDRYAGPLLPEDLAHHECILLDRTAQPGVWHLMHGSETRDIDVSGRFRTDSLEAARAALNSGLGLALVSRWLMQRELSDGSVRAVLAGWHGPQVPIYAYHLGQRNLAPRTRTVIDFLLEAFRSDPGLSDLVK